MSPVTKSDAPQLTTIGQQMWRCPSGVSPIVVNPSGCAGCQHAAAHNIAERLDVNLPLNPTGGRYQSIPLAERQDVASMLALTGRLWLIDHVHRGLIGAEVIYNLGPAADNGSQAWTYEIIGSGPGYLDIRGPNPKFLPVSASRLNPEWPLPDPVTGTLGRIVFSAGSYSLPAGSVVRFLYPSALADRVYPIISKVIPPTSNALDGVTFRVELGDFDATNSRQPWDAAFPPADGKYWCEVRAELLGAATWKDYQAPREIQFAQRRIEIADASGEVELLASDGTGTRVIFPRDAPASFVVEVDGEPLGGIDWNARLRTDRQNDGTYRSWIDLAGLGLTSCDVVCWVEARAGDSGRIPVAAQCIYSRRDLSGSWVHDDEQHCGQADRASGFDQFHDACWLPGKCDQFRLADPLDMDDAAFLASLWSRAGFVIEQGVAGISSSRNFTFAQRGGASIQGLVGSFSDRVPGSLAARREEWVSRALGKRVQWEADGDEAQGLVHGAFWLSPYRFPESAEPGAGLLEYRPSAFGPLQPGVVAELVTGWDAGKPPGDRHPWRYSASTSVYSYIHGGGSLRNVNSPSPSEGYIVAVDLAQGGGPEASRIRSLYGS
jgi:hypothetical protein